MRFLLAVVVIFVVGIGVLLSLITDDETAGDAGAPVVAAPSTEGVADDVPRAPASADVSAAAGRVLDQHGQPVKVAQVSLLRAGAEPVVRGLSGGGRFSFSAMKPGPVRLVAESAGVRSEPLALTLIGGKTHDGLKLTVALPSGGQTGGPVPSDTAGRLIEGLVENERGGGVENAEVWLANPSGRQFGERRWGTDVAGRFAFRVENVPPAIVIHAAAPGYLDGKAELREGKVEIQLKQAAEIVVRVIGADGRPAEGAMVHVVTRQPDADAELAAAQRQWKKPGRQATDADGEARFDTLEPAIYDVYARNEDGSGRIGGVEVPEGGDRETVSLELGAGGTVSGKLINEQTGNAVRGAVVKLIVPSVVDGWRNEAGRLSLTRGDGSFELGPVPPGSWRISVLHTAYEPHELDGVAVRNNEATEVGEIRMQRHQRGGDSE